MTVVEFMVYNASRRPSTVMGKGTRTSLIWSLTVHIYLNKGGGGPPALDWLKLIPVFLSCIDIYSICSHFK